MTQIPYLLSNKKELLKQKVKQKEKENTLTRSEKQLLIESNREFLADLERLKKIVKEKTNEVWNLAVKDTPDGEQAFSDLNKLRDIQRKLKKKSVQLMKIQYKLKNS